MRFRPCIDIHNASVKQIVGSSLADKGDYALDNFVSQQDGAYYAKLYKKYDLRGGHIIILNPKESPYYEDDLKQAFSALKEWEGGLQIGGGINAENAKMFLDGGASHVIVTSYVFKDGQIAWDNLEKLVTITWLAPPSRKAAPCARPVLPCEKRKILYCHRSLAEIH